MTNTRETLIVRNVPTGALDLLRQAGLTLHRAPDGGYTLHRVDGYGLSAADLREAQSILVGFSCGDM